jgi:hypothetical protein
MYFFYQQIMFLKLAVISCLIPSSAFGESTISAWFPIYGDGELWIQTSSPMQASILAIVIHDGIV